MTAGIFTGAVISIEHLIMVVLAGAGSGFIVNRLSKLRVQVNGRLDDLENRVGELESQPTVPPRKDTSRRKT